MLIEFQFFVSRACADILSDALLEAGAVSVLADDADADSLDEQPVYGEPNQPSLPAPVFGWQSTRLTVMMMSEAKQSLEHFSQANALIQGAVKTLPAVHRAATEKLLATAVKPVDDQDWVRLTQQQFEPILVGKSLAIVPSWHLENSVVKGRIVVELDPGLAFGTGSHPTTHLCLQWLEDHAANANASHQSVLDYGCGSGVLAIAAIKLGYASLLKGGVCGIDIDPQAVSSTLENARRNKVQLQAHDTSSNAPQPADIVIANILSNPLKVLAPLLSSLVKPGGHLVISGVLERQIDEVCSAYPSYLNVKPWRVQDGWACLAGSHTIS